jgi:hypothetical protein
LPLKPAFRPHLNGGTDLQWVACELVASEQRDAKRKSVIDGGNVDYSDESSRFVIVI